MTRHIAAAVGFVLVVSAAFALIGTFTAGPDDLAATGDEDGPPVEDPLFDDAQEEPAPADPVDPPDADGGDQPGGPNGQDDDAEDPGGPGDGDGDGEIARSGITVQVLDGYQQDGGAAASRVTQELRDLGYNVVAENPAIAYEVTTVLWNAGTEAEARQLAQDIGAPEVREQPGNLSANVAVHVVVGADRAG